MRGTRPGYRRFRYCPLALAVPDGSGTRDVVNRDEKDRLPPWLRNLGWRLKLKATVRNTRGTDPESLVILVRPDDQQFMIAVFLALKAWVLKRGFAIA